MQRLDGIWGPRYTESERRVRRFSWNRLRARLRALVPVASLPPNVLVRATQPTTRAIVTGIGSAVVTLRVLPWQRLNRFSSSGLQLVAVAVITSALIIALVHPAVSQGIDLLRLIKPGRYLVAFLNSAELRPSGGFLGSFAIAEFDGKTITLEVETNLYKHDNQFLSDHFVPLPKPLDQTWTGRSMSLVNANAAADFAQSAELILNYYEAEYGSRLDGVVGLTVLPVIDLMRLVGPVELPQHNVVLTADNFLSELHQKVQIDYFREPANRLINEPKTIISDLVAQLPARLKQLPPPAAWQLVDHSLKQRNLMFYFRDSPRQQLVEANNWAGQLNPVSSEYLAVYHANYGGGKTSLEINEEMRLEQLTERQRRLTITRTHPGGYDQFSSGENRNYTEIFLPHGSQLLTARRAGQSIAGEVEATEGRFTTFGFWFTTQPTSSQVVTIEYQLPEGLSTGLTIERQPGTLPSKLLVIKGDEVVFSDQLSYDLTLK